MKQLSKLLVIAIVVIAIISLIALNKEGNTEWGNLIFSNIEALASGESGGSGCFGSGSLDCNGSKVQYKFTGYSIEL